MLCCAFADFGFSRVISSTSHVHTKTFGTVTHQPPELLSSGLLTPAADVYGFAMVMWEVYMAQGLFKVSTKACAV